MSGNQSAEAPTGVFILQNDARIGLGSAHRNVDSLQASVKMGINGVTIIANGDGHVTLNEDICIDNICAILKGPDFEESNVLRFTSECCRELRVKKTGTLDLRSFDFGVVEFGGKIKLILEPGAKVLLNGGTLRMADNACIVVDPFVKAEETFAKIPLGALDDTLSPTTSTPSSDPHNQFAPLTGHGQGLKNTDDFRVKFIGIGTILLTECSCITIQREAFAGVETLFEFDENDSTTCQIQRTDLTIQIEDSAEFDIGGACCPENAGGSFQIGNTENHIGHSVNCRLILAGNNAKFRIRKQGFFGVDVGIVDKRSQIPNEWLVDNMHNVVTFTLDLQDGVFIHDRIFDGDDSNASLFAIGQSGSIPPTYNWLLETKATEQEARTNNAAVLGGGNTVLITRDAQRPGALRPIVRTDNDDVVVGDDANGDVIHPRMNVSILSSSPLLDPTSPSQISVDGSTLFDAIKTLNAESRNRCGRKANAAPDKPEFRGERNNIRIGFVDRGQIARQTVYDIFDNGTVLPAGQRERAEKIGAVYGRIDKTKSPPAPMLWASQIQ